MEIVWTMNVFFISCVTIPVVVILFRISIERIGFIHMHRDIDLRLYSFDKANLQFIITFFSAHSFESEKKMHSKKMRPSCL